MPLTPTYTYGMRWLQPYYNDKTAREINVQLAAGTYAAGVLLGQATNVGTNAVQTITETGTPTGGSFTVTLQPYTSVNSTSATVPYNATAAVLKALLDPILGVGNTLVTGGALPGTGLVVTYKGELAAQTVSPIVIASYAGLTGGSTPTAVVTQTTPGVANAGVFSAYASGNSDGTQVPKGFLKYPCVVDASGNITISGSIPGFTEPVASMYYAGAFRIEETTGLDANAVTVLGGNIAIGSLTSGVFRF